MRELKFRAWDKKEKVMYICFATDLLIHFDGRLQSINENGVINGTHNTPDLKLMQFTGIRDKNDVAIYEGDILDIVCYSHHECEDDYRGEVVMGNLVGTGLIYKDKNGEEKCQPLWNLTGSYTTEYYVIGNIYETPHLLSNQPDNPILEA